MEVVGLICEEPVEEITIHLPVESGWIFELRLRHVSGSRRLLLHIFLPWLSCTSVFIVCLFISFGLENVSVSWSGGRSPLHLWISLGSYQLLLHHHLVLRSRSVSVNNRSARERESTSHNRWASFLFQFFVHSYLFALIPLQWGLCLHFILLFGVIFILEQCHALSRTHHSPKLEVNQWA